MVLAGRAVNLTTIGSGDRLPDVWSVAVQTTEWMDNLIHVWLWTSWSEYSRLGYGHGHAKWPGVLEVEVWIEQYSSTQNRSLQLLSPRVDFPHFNGMILKWWILPGIVYNYHGCHVTMVLMHMDRIQFVVIVSWSKYWVNISLLCSSGTDDQESILFTFVH